MEKNRPIIVFWSWLVPGRAILTPATLSSVPRLPAHISHAESACKHGRWRSTRTRPPPCLQMNVKADWHMHVISDSCRGTDWNFLRSADPIHVYMYVRTPGDAFCVNYYIKYLTDLLFTSKYARILQRRKKITKRQTSTSISWHSKCSKGLFVSLVLKVSNIFWCWLER
jgi:hypothetical protein